MSDAALALRQVRYENRAFWRNPAAAFFTFAFPLLFMVIFNVIFGSQQGSGPVRASDFFTPGIIVFSVITATYTNIAMSVTYAREAGVLKRVRGTPLPSWAYLFGRIAHAVLVALLLVVIVAAFGALAYQVEVPWERLPQLVLTLVIGAATFCALGLAVSALVPSADAGPAVVNATILPLLFISNVFIRLEDPPAWMDLLARVFPVRHFADAMLATYTPVMAPDAVLWQDWLIMAAWGLAAVVFSIRFFSWEPRH
ncbi:MAG TPA: ABC transporter permease [candidate division Zixibacteria bacterium]|nr:ABC transporter permease [candidate division Zixibacteria bacterium]